MRLIDGDAVYAKINKLRDSDKLNGYELILLDTVLAVVKCAETVDPVKHGHWIFDEDLISSLLCSECDIHFRWINAKRPNFCPNCGAKMSDKVSDK